MYKQGLTLIEVIISILLFSVVLLGAMAFYFYSDSSFRFAEHKKMALEIADAKMEELKADGYGALPPDGPDGLWVTESYIDDNDIHIGSLPLDSVTRNIYVYDMMDPSVPEDNYKLVRIEVVWADPSRTVPQNITLETYIAPE